MQVDYFGSLIHEHEEKTRFASFNLISMNVDNSHENASLMLNTEVNNIPAKMLLSKKAIHL